MLDGRLIGLEEYELRFISEDHEHFKIMPDEISSVYLQGKVIEKDIVEGYLLNNRYFKMFGGIYNGRYISCQGYVYSCYNNPPDKLVEFDRITFSGKPVDVFAGGSANVMIPVEDGIDWEERAFSIKPKHWDQINTRYSAVIDGIACEVGIDYLIYYNNVWGERSIGTCIPRFYIDFRQAVSIEMIPNCYLWVFDFMKFLSFRRNIKFDEIKIYRHSEGGKFKQSGIVHIGTVDRGEYTNTERNTIVVEDIDEKFGELFQYIAERRQKDTSDELFFPDNDKAYKDVTHTSFLECALSFEGEYDRTQETKTEINAKFRQVKELAINVTVDETCKLAGDEDDNIKIELLEFITNGFQASIGEIVQQSSKTQARKITDYAKKILDDLNKIDFSLEEQFNYLLKQKYSNILEDYQKSLASKMGISLTEKINFGEKFANMRNAIGHGHPKKLEDIHIYVYRLARCMIYVMILDNIGISHNKIKIIVKKIFR